MEGDLGSHERGKRSRALSCASHVGAQAFFWKLNNNLSEKEVFEFQKILFLQNYREMTQFR